MAEILPDPNGAEQSAASAGFTPELLEKGRQVTAYYQRDDLPPPSDDETARPSPLKQVKYNDDEETEQTQATR